MPEVAAAPVAQAPVAPAAAPAPSAPAVQSAETAPAPEGTETKPETAIPPEKRGQSGFERRISRLVRERAEAQAERDLYRRQLEEAKPQVQQDPGEPRISDFKDIEEYAAAKAKYASERALKQDREKSIAAQHQARAKELSTSWEQRIAAADEKYPDFEEVVGEIKPLSPL